MASIDVLYACTGCHRKYSLEELSPIQQLCKDCRKKFPSVQCLYCQLDFHQLDKTADKSVCEQCSKELKQYGPPSNCLVCNLPSAFKGDRCVRCLHSQKKYGPPTNCDHCKLCCAFVKSNEAKKKVNGKTLCLLCTLNYKKLLFRKRSGGGSHHFSDKIGPPSQKKVRLAEPAPKKESIDPFGSELMQQMEKLQYEVSSLKKQLVQKDQQLLEKDKLICTLKAENIEREKDHRSKLHTLLRQHGDVVEDMKTQLQTFKKQNSQSTKTRNKLPPAPPH